MSEYEDFDLDTFQDRVLLEVAIAQGVYSPVADVSILGSLTARVLAWIDALIRPKAREVVEELDSTDKVAQEVVKRPEVWRHLCPALESASDDAFEIAKIITPVLVTLVLAGNLSIPLEPVLFATISIVIARMGIASLCVDFEKEKEHEKED